MIQSFTIPLRMPGMNEILGEARHHWRASASQKKAWTDVARRYAQKSRLAPVEGPVLVRFEWLEPDRRRDPDNISSAAKFVFDGLVWAGVLPDDTWQTVRAIDHRFPGVDKQKPRVIVSLIPWDAVKENKPKLLPVNQRLFVTENRSA